MQKVRLIVFSLLATVGFVGTGNAMGNSLLSKSSILISNEKYFNNLRFMHDAFLSTEEREKKNDSFEAFMKKSSKNKRQSLKQYFYNYHTRWFDEGFIICDLGKVRISVSTEKIEHFLQVLNLLPELAKTISPQNTVDEIQHQWFALALEHQLDDLNPTIKLRQLQKQRFFSCRCNSKEISFDLQSPIKEIPIVKSFFYKILCQKETPLVKSFFYKIFYQFSLEKAESWATALDLIYQFASQPCFAQNKTALTTKDINDLIFANESKNLCFSTLLTKNGRSDHLPFEFPNPFNLTPNTNKFPVYGSYDEQVGWIRKMNQSFIANNLSQAYNDFFVAAVKENLQIFSKP